MPGAGERHRIVVLRDMTASIQAHQHMDFLTQHDLLTRRPTALTTNYWKIASQARTASNPDMAVLESGPGPVPGGKRSLNHRAGHAAVRDGAAPAQNALCVRTSDVVPHRQRRLLWSLLARQPQSAGGRGPGPCSFGQRRAFI